MHDFTSQDKPESNTVNVEQIATAFWNDANIANSAAPEATFTIKEKSLTGNMDIQEMLDRKIQWKTVDDHMLQSRISRDTDFSAITLEAQRIRVFNIEYTVKTMSPLFLQ